MFQTESHSEAILLYVEHVGCVIFIGRIFDESQFSVLENKMFRGPV